jgi:hypothetical protein
MKTKIEYEHAEKMGVKIRRLKTTLLLNEEMLVLQDGQYILQLWRLDMY